MSTNSEETERCSHCKEQVVFAADVCPNCRTRRESVVSSARTEERSAPPLHTRSGRKWMAIVLVLLVATAGYFVFRPRLRYAKIHLPLGVSIEVPKAWTFNYGDDKNLTVGNAGELATKRTIAPVPSDKKVVLFGAKSSGAHTFSQIAISAERSAEVHKPAELLKLSPKDTEELEARVSREGTEALERMTRLEGRRLVSFTPTRREIVDGHPARIIEFVTTEAGDAMVSHITVLFIERMEIKINMKYRQSEAETWKPVVAHMRSTLKVSNSSRPPYSTVTLPLGVSINVPNEWILLNDAIYGHVNNVTIKAAGWSATNLVWAMLPEGGFGADQQVNEYATRPRTIFLARSASPKTYCAIAIVAAVSSNSPSGNRSVFARRPVSVDIHDLSREALLTRDKVPKEAIKEDTQATLVDFKVLRDKRRKEFDTVYSPKSGESLAIVDGHPGSEATYSFGGSEGTIVARITRVYLKQPDRNDNTKERTIELNVVVFYPESEAEEWAWLVEHMFFSLKVQKPA